MDNVRVGVVGVGRMGQRHCRVLSNMRKCQLVGVCDYDESTASKVAKQFEAAAFSDLEDLLGQVDAVVLATPTKYHREQALQCIAHGTHVLIEKPIAASLEQAKEMADAADQSGLVVQVGHIERFNPAYMELKNLLPELKPLAITVNRLSPFLGSNTDVDVVLDLMIHDTNLVLDMIGCFPQKMEAMGLTAFSGTVDHAVAHMAFDGGPILTLTGSRITEHKVRKIDVTSREAFIECDLLNKNLAIHRSTQGEYLNAIKRGVKYRQESIIEQISIPAFEPLLLELQHFVDCVLEKKAPFVTALDGYEAMEMAIQIRDLAKQNMINMDRRKSASKQ
jgi:predicted dehydrogenase